MHVIATATMGTCTSPLQHFRFLTADGQLGQSEGWFLLSASLQIETQQPSVQQTMRWFCSQTRLVTIVQADMYLRPTSHNPALSSARARDLCGTAVMMRQNIFRWPKGLCCHWSNLQSSFAHLPRKALFSNKVKTFSLYAPPPSPKLTPTPHSHPYHHHHHHHFFH